MPGIWRVSIGDASRLTMAFITDRKSITDFGNGVLDFFILKLLCWRKLSHIRPLYCFTELISFGQWPLLLMLYWRWALYTFMRNPTMSESCWALIYGSFNCLKEIFLLEFQWPPQNYTVTTQEQKITQNHTLCSVGKCAHTASENMLF